MQYTDPYFKGALGHCNNHLGMFFFFCKNIQLISLH